MIAKKVIRLLGFIILLFIVPAFLCSYIIASFSKPFLYENSPSLPVCRVALVLGTSPKLSNGAANLYFAYRMDAAERLYKSGKASFFILSGDNRVNNYNEPRDMKEALVARGVPDSCLFTDYAGLRTFDSMIRCKEIFGQDSVIVVSQQFHNERAVYIGRKNGMIAFGFNAKEVTTQHTLKIKIRELFSRMKCMLDIYVLDTRPRHLGEKIKLPA